MSSPGTYSSHQPSKKRPSLSSASSRGKHSRNNSTFSSRLSQLPHLETDDISSPRAKSSITGVTHNDDASESEVDEGDFGENSQVALDDAQEKARMRILLDSFSPAQMARYEVFRRVGLNRGLVKKLVSSITSQSVPLNIALVVAGASKVAIGEIIEDARRIRSASGGSGPLEPENIRDAYARYRTKRP